MKKQSMNTKAIIVIYVLCLSSIVAGMNLFISLRSYTPVSSYNISRHIQYSFTIQNKTHRLVEEAHFWTYAPVRQTSTQKCLGVNASHPYELITDELGNQILHFTFQNVAPYASLIVTVTANVLLSEKPNRIGAEDLSPYLRAEPYCESDDPEIVRVAKKLKKSKALGTVEKTLHWVEGNLTYTGYLRHARGALYALKNKMGDCTEFVYLFTALCRANRIPAKGIAGYIINENAVLKPGGYHNWALFYDDGLWKNADPQKNAFLANQTKYIAMNLIGKSQVNPLGEYYRFRIDGEGLKVKMNG